MFYCRIRFHIEQIKSNVQHGGVAHRGYPPARSLAILSHRAAFVPPAAQAVTTVPRGHPIAAAISLAFPSTLPGRRYPPLDRHSPVVGVSFPWRSRPSTRRRRGRSDPRATVYLDGVFSFSSASPSVLVHTDDDPPHGDSEDRPSVTSRRRVVVNKKHKRSLIMYTYVNDKKKKKQNNTFDVCLQ